MVETSISSFVDSISIYRSRVPKSTWRSKERQRKNDSEKQRKNGLRHDLKKWRDDLKRKIWFEEAQSSLQICRRRTKNDLTLWRTRGRRSETRVLKTRFPQIETQKLDFYLGTRVLDTRDASFQLSFQTWQQTKFFNI